MEALALVHRLSYPNELFKVILLILRVPHLQSLWGISNLVTPTFQERHNLLQTPRPLPKQSLQTQTEH